MHNFKWLLFLLFISPANAQQTVITRPYVAPQSNLPAINTITITDQFQTVFPANNNRSSCTIQNKASSNSMWVCFTARSSCTKANSVQLTPPMGISCNNGSVVLRDEVSITGTSGDTFYAASQ